MCWSRLSFVLRPPWTPERPRYPIRLKVRLMDCPGRAEKDPTFVLRILASTLVRSRGAPSARAIRRLPTHARARPPSPAQLLHRFSTTL